jgi:pimeloyl-ACP methyl ester carboxylesterase
MTPSPGSKLLMSRRRLFGLAAAGAVAAAGRGARAEDAAAAATAPAETVRFTSRDGVVLAGNIYLPADAPPALGVVYVDGGGPTPRKEYLGPLYAPQGVAILTYDKRGVAESGGEYGGRGSFSGENLGLLAADAAAAVDTLAAHPKLRGRPIGLVGASQAGWVIPNAATMNPKVRLMVLWSGPVCPVSAWIETRLAAGNARPPTAGQDGAARPDFRERLAQMRADGGDVDPRVWLANLTIPGLWVFGGKDENIPVDLSISELKKLIEAGRTNYEYKLYPEGGHVDMGPSQDEALALTLDWERTKVRAG